jgi:aldehyde dehydrogenase (NAD+)
VARRRSGNREGVAHRWPCRGNGAQSHNRRLRNGGIEGRFGIFKWRSVPAPVRGDLVRQIGNALRAAKGDLAELVTIETGKIIVESEGEVQEMIDICDFATGLSRQLHGLTIASERPAIV